MRRPFSALALLALVGCTTSPTSTAPSGDKELSRNNNLARVAFEDGSTAKAIDLYGKALQRARAMDDATEIGNAAYNLALCHVILGQLDQASVSLAEAKTAFKRSGGNPADVLLLEATIAQRHGKREQSLSLADQVLSASPDESHRFQVALLKGTIAREQGDVARTRAALAEAEKIRVTNPTLLAAKERLAGNICLPRGRRHGTRGGSTVARPAQPCRPGGESGMNSERLAAESFSAATILFAEPHDFSRLTEGMATAAMRVLPRSVRKLTVD